MRLQPAQTLGPEDADRAETSRLGEAIGTLLPALEHFNRYEGPDSAARNRKVWQDHLEREWQGGSPSGRATSIHERQ
ncbi:MAG: hypothetical protein ACRDFY_09155 [Candidatus Limnocylindria bacterium]